MDASSFIESECTELFIYDFNLYDCNPCGIDAPRNLHGWRALGERIGEHEKLRRLSFGQFNAPTESLKALLRGVSQNRSVRELAFSHSRGNWPLGILAPLYKNLHSLRVDECNLSRRAIRSLSTALRGCSLERFQWFHSTMGDETAVEFIESLAGLSRLKYLELYQCDIRSCNAMAELLLSPNCRLKKVLISLNSISDKEIYALVLGLGGNRTLAAFLLRGNGHTTTEAWQSFVGMLSTPTCTLKHLGLLSNIIDDNAMVALADALRGNSRLKKLWLGDRSISSIRWAQVFGGEQMNTNIAPHVLAWLGGYESTKTCADENICTAVYGFLRKMPALCGSSCRVVRRSTRKRKTHS